MSLSLAELLCLQFLSESDGDAVFIFEIYFHEKSKMDLNKELPYPHIRLNIAAYTDARANEEFR